MKVPYQYKRRTSDEAQELAREAFRSSVASHLSEVEMEELRQHGSLSAGGSMGQGWESILGHTPEPRMHYEFSVYRPSDKCPYIEKYFARILVSRDRSSSEVQIWWNLPVPQYHGPEFT